MLNITIPMAGRGKRFAEAGYALPKPLIPIHGVPMIELVVENVRPSRPHRFTFVVLEDHLEQFGFGELLRRIAPGCSIVSTDGVTEGAACTVLLARDLIDNDDPLMLVNSDQWVDVSIDEYLAVMDEPGTDGLIMTMWADDPKWSYARFDQTGNVSEVVEKQVVSNEATVGIYNYRQGRDFVRAAQHMIDKDLRVGGEFYVAPVYNELIAGGAKIRTSSVGKAGAGMYGLGIPADLERFQSDPISLRAVQARYQRLSFH